jgi:cell division protein FtsI (penicillin-binding protein 3)
VASGSVWRPPESRLTGILILFAVGFGLLTLRAADLMLLPDERLDQTLASRSQQTVQLQGQRGRILDRMHRELAVSVPVDSVFVDPSLVEDMESEASMVADALGMELAEVRGIMSAEGRFAWLQRAAEPDRVRAVEALGLASIGILGESVRRYPNGELAAQVVGFVGRDGEGLEGIERIENDLLRGEQRRVRVLRDGRRRLLSEPGGLDREGANGGSIVLTLDRRIQHAAEAALRAAIREHDARSGNLVALDLRDGGILALASAPGFDPNRFGRYSPARYRNRAVADLHEPGSTVKPLVVAAALDAGVVGPESEIFCEQGRYRIGKHIIHDHHAYGALPLSDLVAKSSNIGVAKLAEQIGPQRLSELYEAVGFGSAPGAGVAGESAGLVDREPERWKRIELANRAFGQGLAVSTLQIARAMSVIAGSGEAWSPYLVRGRLDASGAVVDWTEPRRLESGLSAESADLVRSYMERAASRLGTGSRAQIPGYRVAGKTGTAQKVDSSTGRYSRDRWYVSFVGFVPVEDPVLLVAVGVDEPKGVSPSGGTVAAPIFREVAQAALSIMSIPAQADLLTLGRDSADDDAEVGAGPEADAVAHAVGAEGVPDPPRHPADFNVLGEDVHLPDLRGWSLRRVVSKASDAGLKLKVRGAGELRWQEPGPGSVVPVGSVLELAYAPVAGGR